MIAALCNQKLLAPFTIEGACNRTVFEIWLETCLVPVLRPGQNWSLTMPPFTKGGGWSPWCKQQAVKSGTCRRILQTLTRLNAAGLG